MLTRIDHVGVAVRDLDSAIDFYQRVYGFRLVHTEVNEAQGVREALLEVGSSGTYVQLLAPLSDDSPVARFIDGRGEGIQQVAFAVDDLEAEAARLRSEGIRLLYDSPRAGTAGSKINFIHPKDAGGVLVELVEPVSLPARTPPDPPAH